MVNNEKIVRELYAAAEGSGKDIAKLVSFFSDEGYSSSSRLAAASNLGQRTRFLFMRWVRRESGSPRPE